MENSYDFPHNNHLESWRTRNQDQVNKVKHFLENGTKAVVVTGAVHSGKTTLALAIKDQLEQTTDEKQGNIKFFFTTPTVQQTFGAIPVVDRSGAIYEKLPTVANVEGSPDTHYYIVIDEISSQDPNELLWKKYIQLPNTSFILLTHPGAQITKKWVDLFSQEEIKHHDMKLDSFTFAR